MVCKNGVSKGNSLDGFEEEAASAEMMKAIATGNNLILVHTKIKTALQTEEIGYKDYTRNLHRNEQDLRNSEKKIDYFEKQKTILLSTKEYIKNFNNDNGLKCSMIKNDLVNGTKNFNEYFIPKNDNSQKIKELQNKMSEDFIKNVNLMFDGSKSIDFCDYKGFIISGSYDTILGNVVFELQNKETKEILSPSNLIYTNTNKNSNGKINLREQIKMTGFFLRLDNYLKNIDKNIETAQNRIIAYKERVDGIKQTIGENKKYPNLELLELLRKEEKIVFKEIEKMSKNKEYKSSFKSQAIEILENKKDTRTKNEMSKDVGITI